MAQSNRRDDAYDNDEPAPRWKDRPVADDDKAVARKKPKWILLLALILGLGIVIALLVLMLNSFGSTRPTPTSAAPTTPETPATTPRTPSTLPNTPTAEPGPLVGPMAPAEIDWNTLVPRDLSRFGLFATIDLPAGAWLQKRDYELRISAGPQDGYLLTLRTAGPKTLKEEREERLAIPESVSLQNTGAAWQVRSGGTVSMANELALGSQTLRVYADDGFTKDKALIDAMWRSVLSLRQLDAQKTAAKRRGAIIAALHAKEIRVTDPCIKGPSVSLTADLLDSAVMQDLVSLRNMDSLEIVGSEPASAEALLRIAELRTLTDLKLSGEWVTNALLANLVDCQALTTLELKNSAVTDDGLAAIGKFPGLLRFEFSFVKPRKVLGPVGLKNLAGLKDLQDLVLSGQVLDKTHLATLGNLKRLTTLEFRSAQFDGTPLADLAKLPKLRSLDFTGSDVRDADLANLKTLSSLVLSNTAITDAAIPHLLAMPDLANLWLDGTQVSAEGLAKLKATRPKVVIKGMD